MKLVLPVGRDKMVTAAEFDAESRYGCACSSVNGKYETDDKARNSPVLWNCQCSCHYGEENNAANWEIGYNSDEWN